MRSTATGSTTRYRTSEARGHYADVVSTRGYDVVDFNRFEKGLGLAAEHNTHGEYDIEVNVEIGVGQVRVVRYPTHQR